MRILFLYLRSNFGRRFFYIDNGVNFFLKMKIIVRFQVYEKSFVDANSRFSKDVFLSSESMRD